MTNESIWILLHLGILFEQHHLLKTLSLSFPVCISGLLINSQGRVLKSSLFTYSNLCSFIGSSSYMLSCLHWFQQLKMIEKYFMHIVMRFFPHHFLIELFSDLYVTWFYDYARNILLWLLSISFPKGRTGKDAIFFYMTLLHFSLMHFLPREVIRGEHRVTKEVFWLWETCILFKWSGDNSCRKQTKQNSWCLVKTIT